MDEGSRTSVSPARLGLCFDCRHRIEQATRKGSLFHRCARADDDERFLRYPPMPVVRCAGYERSGSDDHLLHDPADGPGGQA